MNKIVLDTSAWIEYLAGTEKGKRVKELIERPKTELFATGLIATELAAKFLKESRSADDALKALGSLTSLMSFDLGLAKESAEIYVRHRKVKEKFGLADAHVVAAAKKLSGKVLTFDNDFDKFPEAIVLT